MQTSAVDSMTVTAGGNAGSLQTQIAALRESLRNHRDRARQMWDACAPGEEKPETRLALGSFTEKFLKGQLHEAYG